MHLNSDLDAVSPAETRFICFVQNCWNCPSWCQWLLKIFSLLGNLARWVISFFVLSCYWFQDFFFFFKTLNFLSPRVSSKAVIWCSCVSVAHIYILLLENPALLAFGSCFRLKAPVCGCSVDDVSHLLWATGTKTWSCGEGRCWRKAGKMCVYI